jgi:Lon protease-like protein
MSGVVMELPLFPLNSVLFPGMPIRLHIFEARYKQMINECRDSQTPFGIVLIESGREALGPLATPHSVGTTAYITEVSDLPRGNLNIMAVGRERFRIQSLDTQSKPYLMGDVDFMPFDNEMTPGAIHGRDLLQPLMERYLKALEKSGAIQFDNAELPEEPLALAYLSAMLLESENDTKQRLLEAKDTKTLLQYLIQKYRKEVVIMDMLMSPPEEGYKNFPFSFN